MTYQVPHPTPWDALARDLLGSEARMAALLAENPTLAGLAECPAGATVVVPIADVADDPGLVAPTLPPWKRA